MAHVPYDFGLMYRVQGHFHAKEFLLILCGQCHLKMDIYYLDVRIAINAHEEVLLNILFLPRICNAHVINYIFLAVAISH